VIEVGIMLLWNYKTSS